MKAGIFVLFGIFFSSMLRSEEIFEFSGSYQEQNDAFALRFYLDENPGRAAWDGQGENLQERENPTDNRIRLGFDLSNEEDRVIRALLGRFHWARSRAVVLGSGLSIRAGLWINGEQSFSNGYFGVRPDERLGRRGEALPLLFQNLAADGKFSPEDRSAFFAEAKSLSSDLADYDAAYSLLEQCRADKTPVPWDQVTMRVVKPFPPHFPEIAADLPRHEAEAALVIDAMLKEGGMSANSDASPSPAVMVSVESILIEHPEYGGVEFLPESIKSPSPMRWGFLDPSLRCFLEDYAVGPEEKATDCRLAGDFEFQEYVRKATPAQIERAGFLRRSGYRSLVVPGTAESAIGHLVIHRLAFEGNLTRCFVQAGNPKSSKPVTLLELKDAGWKILRQISFEDWEEYGWKKPLFQ